MGFEAIAQILQKVIEQEGSNFSECKGIYLTSKQ